MENSRGYSVHCVQFSHLIQPEDSLPEEPLTDGVQWSYSEHCVQLSHLKQPEDGLPEEPLTDGVQ